MNDLEQARAAKQRSRAEMSGFGAPSARWSCVLVCLAVTAACSGHRGTSPGAVTRAGVRVPAALPLPGCTPDVARTLDHEITELWSGIARPSPPPLTVDAARAELHVIWKNPCMALLARFIPAPEPATRADLEWLVKQDLLSALQSANGATPSESGERPFVIPPELPPPLAPDVRRALDPWLCNPDESACGARAASYIARAEAFFEEEEGCDFMLRASSGDTCLNREVRDDEKDMTPFERWASCQVRRAPDTYRFPLLRYRAPERGWLVLRGRRDHHNFGDEIHAYDLASGSAYIARREGGPIFVEPNEDPAAAVARRRVEVEVVSGVAVADQIRELAFALVTLAAVGPARSYGRTVFVPSGVAPTLSGSGFRKLSRGRVITSHPSHFAFTLIDGGAVRAQGTATWPDSESAAPEYAGTLWRVLEAGIERSCPPAALPENTVAARADAVWWEDADPADRDRMFAELARVLETHVPPGCAASR